MIEIVTVFLGLVTGHHPIELAVGRQVVRVEVRLDGETLGELVHPPWTIDCDFGDRLAPHELVAIARDAAGRELGRQVSWINVDGGEDRTAVVVALEDGFELPDPARMGSWFVSRGRPLEVERVERGAAEVVIVRDPAAQAYLGELAEDFYHEAYQRLRGQIRDGRVERLDDDQRHAWTDLDPRSLPPAQASAVEVGLTNLRLFARLGADSNVRFVSPFTAAPSRVETSRRIFHRSRRHAPEEGGLLALTRKVPTVLSYFRLADAVAMAGRQLHESGRRRLVVALVAGDWDDASLYDTATVRSYLAELQVPLRVWAFAFPEIRAEWGEITDLSFDDLLLGERRDPLEDAVLELRRELDSQRVVWLRGRHLPSAIELAPAARGVRLAR